MDIFGNPTGIKVNSRDYPCQKVKCRDNMPIVNISQELSTIKQSDFLKKKQRQQLRTNCIELRQLEEQLRVAHTSKELARQMEDLKLRKQAEMDEKNEMEQRIEAERLNALNALRDVKLKEQRDKEQLRSIFYSQIEELRCKRLKEYEEVLEDRDRRLQLQHQIYEEEKCETQQKLYFKLKLKNEMEKYIDMQKQHKMKLKAQEDEECEWNRKYQEELDEKFRQLMETKQERKRNQQQLSEKIGLQVYNLEKEKRRRENVMYNLLEQEYKAKEDDRYRKVLEKQNIERLKARQELERYRAEVIKKKKDVKCTETDYQSGFPWCHQDNHDKDEIKRKRQEQRQAMLEIIEVNRKKRAELAAENVQYYEQLLKKERERDHLIDAERIRILRSQPKEILSYLPRGVIRESDREHLTLPTKN